MLRLLRLGCTLLPSAAPFARFVSDAAAFASEKSDADSCTREIWRKTAKMIMMMMMMMMMVVVVMTVVY